jgi:hypothetical protein
MSLSRIPYTHQVTSSSIRSTGSDAGGDIAEELKDSVAIPDSQRPHYHASLTAKIYETQYGKRTIGFIGGLCLMVNNCLGPGLVQMNSQMQISGWFPTLLAVCLFGLLAFASSWMLLYAQSRVPVATVGRVEFTGVCEFFFERKIFLFCVLFYILTMIVQCISGIQQTMQLLDLMIVRLFGKSCALEIYPQFFSFPCSNSDNGFSVFAAGSGVISLGFVASGLLAIPFGFFPLEDSIIFQIVSCGIMAVSIVMLGVDLSFVGYQPSRLPAIGESMSGLVGLMMFNFSLAFSLPSWNNERKHSVRVKRSVGSAIGIGSVTMLVLGILGALAFAPVIGSDKNLIDFASDTNRPVTIAAVYIFSLANNVTTVPVFSIMIRYTLLEHKILRKPWIANILAIGVPWLLVIPFSTGASFQKVVDLGGSIFIGITCFVAPPILFVCALRPKWIFKNRKNPSVEYTEDVEVNNLTPMTSELETQTDNDAQFPPITGDKHVNYMSAASLVLLAGLIGCLIYSWVNA